MSVLLEEFLPDIEPELMQCPVPVIERRLREAAIELCEDTLAWRYEYPEIQVIQGQQLYTFAAVDAGTLIEPIPDEGEVHSIIVVRDQGNPLHDITLFETRDYARTRGTPHRAHGYLIPDRGCVQLNYIPKASSDVLEPLTDPRVTKGLEISVSLKPTRTCTTLPDVIFRDYHRQIVVGTIGKAMQMKDRPWTNFELAEAYNKGFKRLVAEVKKQVDRGFTHTDQRIRPRKFG